MKNTPSKVDSPQNEERRRNDIRLLMICVCLLIITFIVYELKTSRFQSWYFSRFAGSLTYKVTDGESKAVRFPTYGPYDIRLGYTRIPAMVEGMKSKGFSVTKQAQWSDGLLDFADHELFPPYVEKMKAGILILDNDEDKIFQSVYPRREYPDFASIPPIVVRMLLFIENRGLLDTNFPYRNPAIDWTRLSKAFWDIAISAVNKNHHVAGGSTLATQIEKFRHSEYGITSGAQDKLRQIISATVRAYQAGEQTGEVRKRIVLDYVNSIPLAAAKGVGEVIGLGEGLWAWYEMDFDKVNQTLTDADHFDRAKDHLDEIGVELRAVLSLFISQRRPSMYLRTKRENLKTLTDQYIRLMMKDNILLPHIGQSALTANLEFRKNPVPVITQDITQQKVANLIRSRLLGDSKMERMYDLERLDLTVRSTIDSDLHRKITNKFFALRDPKEALKAGLIENRLLAKGDPAKVIYSFSLYEHTDLGNFLRVQTNNFEGPFNIDEQMKLDLGSSAKLRTLVHYFEIIADLYKRYTGKEVTQLKAIGLDPAPDALTRWTAAFLAANPGAELAATLDAAMNRVYSANPTERFFTGGGLLTFGNFNNEDNNRSMTLRMAFQNSVNLVFIRLMRDIAHYHIFQRYKVTPKTLSKLDESEKRRLLAVFADQEGKTFIRRFWQKYTQKTPQEIIDLFFMGIHPVPTRLTAAFRYLEPEAPVGQLAAFLKGKLPNSNVTEAFAQRMYKLYNPVEFDLADIGFIDKVHPLELWVAKFLLTHPGASLKNAIEESANERQAVYKWLFKSQNSQRHYQRIRTVLELEAFSDIHRAWKRLGYPFEFLVPSYASAIGSSADRPGALAELVGIILNHGIRYPMIRIKSLHFAEHTPYETVLNRLPTTAEQVLEPEVAQQVKEALLNVVANGTATRLRNAVKFADGSIVALGGKTGTGDHRYKTFGRGGKLIDSRVMNRDATFAFFIGDRFFGSINAFVAGDAAAGYSFTSSLPVQVLKYLLPDLIPFIETHGSGREVEKPSTEKS